MRLVLPEGFSQQRQQFRPISEIDYRALRLLAERSIGASRMKKEQKIRALDKAYREGKMGYPEEEPPEWKWRMCEARMLMGNYSDWRGWEYRSDWSAGVWHNDAAWKKVAGRGSDTDLYYQDGGAWMGQYVDLLQVHGEQGIGDEVCFAQVLLNVKKDVGRVVLETDKRLIPAFERSLGIECLPAVQIDGERHFRRVDEIPWITLGEVLRNYIRSRGDFHRKPYLTAAPEQIEKWSAYRGRVGISWRGAQGSYPLAEFAALADNPLGLQYDLAWDEEIERPAGLALRSDIEGLLGLLSNLSRVVTVSTSVAHFCGALGVKTDVILAPMNGVRQNMLPFKWGLGGSTPWYGDHVRVYPNLTAYKARVR